MRRVNAGPTAAVILSILAGMTCLSLTSPVLGLSSASAAQAKSSAASAALALLNDYRVSQGLGKVQFDSALNAMAQRQSDAMLAAKTMSHDVAGGFSSRIAQSGISAPYAAENVAYGYASANSVFEGWRQSSGHNANMLLAQATRVGVAMARDSGGIYWTMVLASSPR